MADITNVSTPVVRPSTSTATQGSARPSASHRAAFVNADEVSRRANVINEIDSPQNVASLNRLDRILSSGQPLRGDVPRGFYLDLKV